MRRFGDGMANAGLMGLRGRMMDRRPAPMNRPMPPMPPMGGGAPMAPPPAPPMGGGAPAMRKGGKVKKMAKGGSTASKRADGCATKGKTKGKFV